MTNTCEVRVPTFRRPELLERALRSLCAQTHREWRCIVFDDCPDGTAARTVDLLCDSRITYSQNASQLGAIGNIDRCFRNAPYVGGEFGYVLEDDNFLLPEHISYQLELARVQKVEVVLSCQVIENVVAAQKPGVISTDRTLVPTYPVEGRYKPRELYRAVLFSHAFSNGSVFWRIGKASEFEVGSLTTRPGVQEILRAFGFASDVFISHQATAVWRSNTSDESYVNSKVGSSRMARLRRRIHNLRTEREIMELRRCYVDALGVEATLQELAVPPVTPEQRLHAEDALLACGFYVVLTPRPIRSRLLRMGQGLAFRVAVKNELASEALSARLRPRILAGM